MHGCFSQEARVAVEQIVIPKGQPVELLSRSPEVIALQVKLVEGYQLASEKAGSEMSLRLRILPMIIQNEEENFEMDEETFDMDEEFDSDAEDLGVSIAGGTSPGRLPILPE